MSSKSIHVAANGKISLFLRLSNMPFYVYVCHIFIHLSVDRYIGCFHILTIINNASMNIGVHVSFCINVFGLGVIYPGVEFLDYMVVLSLLGFFEKPPFCFPQWLYQFTLVPTMYEGSLSSTSLPTFVVCVLIDDYYPDRCVVISHCGFGLYFTDDQKHWASFRVPVGHLHFLLEKMAVQSFCVASLYIFQKSEVFNLFCFWEKEMTGGTSCEFKSICFSISAEPLVSYLTSVSLATWALPC